MFPSPEARLRTSAAPRSRERESCARVKVGGTDEKLGALISRDDWSEIRAQNRMGVVAFDHQWGHTSSQLAPSLNLSCAKQRVHAIQPLGPQLAMNLVPGRAFLSTFYSPKPK